jgi:hypothetical protein
MVYFQTKNPICVNFVGSCNRRYWYILWPFGIFYGNLEYFMIIWYIVPVLVSCTGKNLATLRSENPKPRISIGLANRVKISRAPQSTLAHVRSMLAAIFFPPISKISRQSLLEKSRPLTFRVKKWDLFFTEEEKFHRI